MVSFLEHILNEAEEKRQKNLIVIDSKNDVSSKVKDKWFQICLSWLFSVSKDLESISFVDNAEKQRQQYLFRTFLQFKQVNSREERNRKAEDILKNFEDGPFLVPEDLKPDRDKDSVDFVWYADSTNIDKEIHQNFPLLKKLSIVAKNKSSETAHYPFAYYRVSFKKNGSKAEVYDVLKAVFADKHKFSTDKKIATEASKKISVSDASKIDISIKCLVDFTVKMASSDYVAGSKVKNADTILDAIPTSILPISESKTKGYSKYSAFAKNGREKILSSIASSIKESILPNVFDKEIYSNFFSAIAKCCEKNTSDDFKLNSFKEQTAFNGITFKDFLKEVRYYGAVMSELFVPFLLLAGFSSIDGKDILMPSENQDSPVAKEKVVSIEFPKKSNEKLRDYNAIFADTESGKRYAISAKFGGGAINHTSLFALVKENRTFANSVVKDIVAKNKNSKYKLLSDTVSGKKGTYKTEIVKLASAVLKKPNLILDYEKTNGQMWTPGSTDVPENAKAMVENSIPSKHKQKVAIDLYPYSLPVVCDFELAKTFTSDSDFLEETYRLIFEYYGKDVDFMQMTLKEDFSIEYITKKSHAKDDPITDKIEIVATSSFRKIDEAKEDKKWPYSLSYVPQPLHVVLK